MTKRLRDNPSEPTADLADLESEESAMTEEIVENLLKHKAKKQKKKLQDDIAPLKTPKKEIPTPGTPLNTSVHEETSKEIRVGHRYGFSFLIQRICDFLQDVLFHSFVIQVPTSMIIQSKSTYFTARFALFGEISVISGTTRYKVSYEIILVQFTGHITKIIA